MLLGCGTVLFSVQPLCRGLRLTHQRNLAILALGVFRIFGDHLTLSETARSVPARSDH